MQDIVLKFGKYFLMVVISALSFLGGSTTDSGQAVQIALDKDKAIAQAIEIIQDTPRAEVKKVKDEIGE